MAPVGEPLKAPAGQTWTAARISGNRVIGLTGSAVVAVDAGTGKPLWTRPGTWFGVATTARAIILVQRGDVQPEALTAPENRILTIHDPATGAQRWKLPHTTADRLVLHRDVLVRLDAATGRIRAHDLPSGKSLWSAAAGATLISGMETEADASEDHGGVSGALYQPETEKAFPFSDDRLVSITAEGRVTIRNIRSGKVLSTAQGRAGAEGLLGYEGSIYTEVSGAGGRAVATPARLLYAPSPPWYWNDFFPCGRERACMYEYRDIAPDKQEAHLLVIDRKSGEVVRTTGAVPLIGTHAVRLGHIMTSAGGDKGTALYDENGQARYSDHGIGGFVDDGNALTLTRDAGDGRFTVRGISNIDFQRIKLGTMPEISGRCDWNEDLLTCPTGRGLYVWRFTR
jgi:hypothetical protein